MSSYDWTQRFKFLYDHALALYAEGQRGADSFFNRDETAWLASIGMRPIELYDFVEDFSKGGDPDFATTLLITAARRDYFLTIQKGQWSGCQIDMDQLPPKDATAEGIVWLPRIIPKARAKLRGEMPADLMFDCGGDRRFFKEHKIHPSDFLRVVWAAGENDPDIIAYVKKASAA